jgi:hypothetical protein
VKVRRVYDLLNGKSAHNGLITSEKSCLSSIDKVKQKQMFMTVEQETAPQIKQEQQQHTVSRTQSCDIIQNSYVRKNQVRDARHYISHSYLGPKTKPTKTGGWATDLMSAVKKANIVNYLAKNNT